MKAKIVTLTEFEVIEQAICVGENIPRVEVNGYKVESYLGEAVNYKHTTLDQYQIPKDVITEKYCGGFVELTDDWFPEDEEI